MTVTSRIAYGAAVLAIVAGSWLALAWRGTVIEGPSRGAAQWAVETGGVAGGVAFILILLVGCYGGAYLLNRHDEASRSAADRTIHVEQSRWTPAFRCRLAWLCLPVALVLASTRRSASGMPLRRSFAGTEPSSSFARM